MTQMDQMDQMTGLSAIRSLVLVGLLAALGPRPADAQPSWPEPTDHDDDLLTGEPAPPSKPRSRAGSRSSSAADGEAGDGPERIFAILPGLALNMARPIEEDDSTLGSPWDEEPLDFDGIGFEISAVFVDSTAFGAGAPLWIGAYGDVTFGAIGNMVGVGVEAGVSTFGFDLGLVGGELVGWRVRLLITSGVATLFAGTISTDEADFGIAGLVLKFPLIHDGDEWTWFGAP